MSDEKPKTGMDIATLYVLSTPAYEQCNGSSLQH